MCSGTIPPRSRTAWHYGLIPSSYGAICHQFGHPRGAVTLAEARWRKGTPAAGGCGLSRSNRRNIEPKTKKREAPPAGVEAGGREASVEGERASRVRAGPGDRWPAGGVSTLGYLRTPPRPVESDEEELLAELRADRGNWRGGTAIWPRRPTASPSTRRPSCWPTCGTARHPTPYDFRDAAVTCIEKEVVPGKRERRAAV